MYTIKHCHRQKLHVMNMQVMSCEKIKPKATIKFLGNLSKVQSYQTIFRSCQDGATDSRVLPVTSILGS